MNGENNTANKGKKVVLVAPLDWGLGHATRCIPIVNALLKEDISVILAADGPLANLLNKEFPNLLILPLKGYKITYGRGRQSLVLKIISQLPRIIRTIRFEQKWLNDAIATHKLDAVISDNRFGLHSKKTRSIYITHQLFIETGNNLFNRIAQKIHYRFINQYDECWIPDAKNIPDLAGQLSHPIIQPRVKIKYLGPLSRFTLRDKVGGNKSLVILLSGPEPTRTEFEDSLLAQLKAFPNPVSFIRGLPGVTRVPVFLNKNIKFYNHLPAEELGALIERSGMLIARSGYSTIMDLCVMKKKAILIPTPGQPEQEWLASYLGSKQMFLTYPQQNFRLEDALKTAKDFPFKTFDFSTVDLTTVIAGFARAL